jgi:hypothetical protein
MRMSVSKLNIITIITIVLSISLFIAPSITAAFSQTNTNKGNASRDTFGNLIHGNSTSMKGTGNNLTKDYPTNATF